MQGNKASSDGAGIYVDNGTLVMTGGSVSGNNANDNGGGIYTTDNAVLTLTGAVISGNTSQYGGGGLNIHLKDNTSTITDCTIAYNKSEKSDGGGFSLSAANKTLTVTNTSISNNNASDEGGGIYIDHGTLIMDKGSVDVNSAEEGGGVYITGGDYLTLQNGAVVSKNYTTKRSGGGISCHGFLTINRATVSNNCSAQYGGGIFYQNSGEEITLTDAAVSGNYATEQGGGIYVKQGDVTLSGGSISENSAPEGAGVYVNEKTKLNANGVTFSENTTVFSEYSTNYPDAFDMMSEPQREKYLTEAGNASEENSGGGLYNNGETTLTSCTFTDNSADYSGGGVFTKKTLKIAGSTFTGNKAVEQYGGAIFLADGDVSLWSINIRQSFSCQRPRSDTITRSLTRLRSMRSRAVLSLTVKMLSLSNAAIWYSLRSRVSRQASSIHSTF